MFDWITDFDEWTDELGSRLVDWWEGSWGDDNGEGAPSLWVHVQDLFGFDHEDLDEWDD